MGDVRYEAPYERVRQAEDRSAAVRALDDNEVIAALAAASRGKDPYLANVLATEAHNRMHRAHAVTTHLAEGVMALDKEGRVTFVNPAALGMLGWTRTDLLGRAFYGAVCPEDACPLGPDGQPWLRMPDAVLVRAETLHGENVSYRRRDGSLFPVDCTLSPILRNEDVQGAVVVFRDATARVEGERRRAARLAVMEILAESATVEEAMPRVIRAFGERLGWSAGVLWVLDAGIDALRSAATWTAEGHDFSAFHEAGRNLIFPRGIGLPGRAWQERRPVHVPNVVEDPECVRFHAAEEAGLHAGFAFPLLAGGEVFGVLEFFDTRERRRDEDLLESARSIGHMIGEFVARRRVEEGRDRLAAIVEASEDAIVSVTREGLVQSWNRGAEKMFGFTQEEAVGKPAWAVSPNPREGLWKGMLDRVLSGERIEQYEAGGQGRDGRHIHFSITVFPTRDASGAINGAAAIVRDVTRRTRTEQALRESEERFRLLAQNAQDVIYRYRLQAPRGFEFVSPSVEAVTGYPPQAFYEDPDLVVRITHPEDRWKILRTWSSGGDPAEPLLVRQTRRDGALVWTESRATLVRDAAGRPLALEGITRDVTALKKAEERFRNLLESAPDAMVIVDREGTITLVNARAERLFGYAREELLGQPVEKLVPSRLRQLHVQHRQEYAEHPRTRAMGAGYDLKAVNKAGEEFPVEISLAPMQTEEGTWITAAVRDVRERRQAEAEHRHLRGP